MTVRRHSVVSRRCDDDDAGDVRAADRFAQGIGRAGFGDRVAERKIDHANVVVGAVSDRPVDAGDYVAREAAAIAAEHANVDQFRAGCDTAVVEIGDRKCWRRRAGDDARDVRPVTEIVVSRRVARHEADARDDLRRERTVRRDTGVDDRDADPLAVDAGNTREAQKAGRARTRLIGRDGAVRYRHPVVDRKIAGQMIDAGIRSQVAQFVAVRGNDRTAGEPANDL